MMCLRCEGLMVFELFEDFEGLSSDYEFTGWRCINCGAIVDPVIAAHRPITSSVVAPTQDVEDHTGSLVIVGGSNSGSSHGPKEEGLA